MPRQHQRTTLPTPLTRTSTMPATTLAFIPHHHLTRARPLLRYRLITGPILILVFLGLVWLDERIGALDAPAFLAEWFNAANPEAATLPAGIILLAVSLLVLPLACGELVRVAQAREIRANTVLTTTCTALTLLLIWQMPASVPGTTAIAMLMTLFAASFFAGMVWFSRGKRVEGVLPATAVVLTTMVYLGIFLGFLLLIRRDHSAWWIVGIVLTVKASDTGAYFTGHAIGRHKLIPWLSPGKTWEGLGGAVVGGALVGFLLAKASGWLPAESDHVNAMVGLLCGGCFALVGQAGDLTMSLLKRGAGIKDSSTILPGLGGVMDVLDSPLLVAPLAYWLLST